MPLIVPSFTGPALGRSSSATIGSAAQGWQVYNEALPFINVGGSITQDPYGMNIGGRSRLGSHMFFKSPEEQARIRKSMIESFVNSKIGEGYSKVNEGRLEKRGDGFTNFLDIDWNLGSYEAGMLSDAPTPVSSGGGGGSNSAALKALAENTQAIKDYQLWQEQNLVPTGTGTGTGTNNNTYYDNTYIDSKGLGYSIAPELVNKSGGDIATYNPEPSISSSRGPPSPPPSPTPPTPKIVGYTGITPGISSGTSTNIGTNFNSVLQSNMPSSYSSSKTYTTVTPAKTNPIVTNQTIAQKVSAAITSNPTVQRVAASPVTAKLSTALSNSTMKVNSLLSNTKVGSSITKLSSLLKKKR